MPAFEFFSLGLTVATLVIRLTGHSDFADSVGDLEKTGSTLHKLRGGDPQARELGESIAYQLEQAVGHLTVDSQRAQDLRALSLDVQQLLTTMFRDDKAILAAAKDPQGIHQYVLHHGGNKIIQLAPLHGEKFTSTLLMVVSEQLARFAPHSKSFSRVALLALLERGDATQATTEQVLDEVRALKAATQQPEQVIQSSEIIRKIHEQRASVRASISDASDSIVVRREGLLALALQARSYPVAFIGDGGFGKSVLVGEIADVCTAREVVLVACSAIDGTDQLQGADQIDTSLGQQISGLAVSLCDALEAFHVRPLLVVDTLDILLREETAAAIGALLSKWSERSDLIVTCRSREWYDLVSARQAAFVAHDMPSLDSDEVATWSARFISHDSAVSHEAAEAFSASLELTLRDPRSLKVLGVPLRLAMATRLYARYGPLPPNLTATQLYKAYWADRVSTGRDGRKNTRRVKMIENAALGIAEGVWAQSLERFREDLRYDGDVEAVNFLISEGVIGEIGFRVHFFHQTFAEFAVARHLAAVGEDEDFVRLNDGLSSQRSGYWGIASHLVHEELSAHRFKTIADHIPLDSVEGVRIVLDGLLERSERELVLEHLDKLVNESPDYFAAASDIVEAAPTEHMYAMTEALCRLAKAGSGDLTAVVRAIASLVRRMPPDRAVDAFGAILDVLDERNHSGDKLVVSESRRLVDAVFKTEAVVDSQLLEKAIEHYRHQPAPGRYAMIMAALRSEDARLQSLLIDQAIGSEVPSGSVDDLAKLTTAEIDDSVRRALRGWHSWTDVLSVPLPRRWDSVQVRIIAHMARDPLVRDELIGEAIAPTVGRRLDIIINALRFVADDQPAQFAIALAGWEGPNDRPTANAYAKLALQLQPTLAETERDALLVRLRTMAEHEPRRVWAAIFKLSAWKQEVLSVALDDLMEAVRSSDAPDKWRSIVEAACDALYQAISPYDLITQMERLRPLWTIVGGIGGAQTGRALGLLAAVSPHARSDFDRIIDSNQIYAQQAGIQSLLAAKNQCSEESWSQSLPWLVALMRVRNNGAAINLINALTAEVADDRWTTAETGKAVNRLVEALDKRDDPQVIRTLVVLLAEASHNGSPTSAPSSQQVELLLAKLAKALEPQAIASDPERAAAIYPQYVAVITGIAMAVLGPARTSVLAEELLIRIDIEPFGGRARKTLAMALASIQRTTPSWWSKLEALWPTVPTQNRGAIADLALSGLVPERAVVSERIARRSDCPPDVAADIHRRIRG